ncbi:MAG: lytic murein transglycosylase, partial [Methylovulum sp.]|nr:lytic murein transglycosylase [Methylovulum sp.]
MQKIEGVFVVKVVNKHLLKSALVIALAGCASEPAQQPSTVAQPVSITPMAKIPVQPLEPYPQAQMPAPDFYNYSAGTLTGTYADYPASHMFIQHLVQKHGFSETYLNGLFSEANRLESVIRLEPP